MGGIAIKMSLRGAHLLKTKVVGGTSIPKWKVIPSRTKLNH